MTILDFIIQKPNIIGDISFFFFFFPDYKIRTLHIHHSCAKKSGKNGSNYIIQIVTPQRLSLFVIEIVSLRTILTIITLVLVFLVIVSCSRCLSIEYPVFRLFDRIAPTISHKIKKKMVFWIMSSFILLSFLVLFNYVFLILYLHFLSFSTMSS